MNYAELNTGQLLAMLDDVVQTLADKSIEAWAEDQSYEKKEFIRIKAELSRRLNKEGE